MSKEILSPKFTNQMTLEKVLCLSKPILFICKIMKCSLFRVAVTWCLAPSQFSISIGGCFVINVIEFRGFYELRTICSALFRSYIIIHVFVLWTQKIFKIIDVHNCHNAFQKAFWIFSQIVLISETIIKEQQVLRINDNAFETLLYYLEILLELLEVFVFCFCFCF